MSSSRVKFVAGVTAAFVGGVIFASSLDLVPWGHAQTATRSRPKEIPEAKGLVEQSNAFVAIAERVTPAVVAIRAERDPKKAATSQPHSNPPTRSSRPPSTPAATPALRWNRARSSPITTRRRKNSSCIIRRKRHT